jgi:mannose-1-phosphate guanylyltransferase
MHHTTPQLRCPEPKPITRSRLSDPTVEGCLQHTARKQAAQGRWAVILAGGRGSRLQSLTRGEDGTLIPKQFCSLAGGRSLLADAVARARLLVGNQNLVVVVAREHAVFWHREFCRQQVRVIAQPDDRGTASALLLAVMAIRRVDPRAQITLLPADHYVEDEAALASTLLQAQQEACWDRPLLLGMPPQHAEDSYGYIVPRIAPQRRQQVIEFVEKPEVAQATELLRRGALWNTMMMVASADSLIHLYRDKLPLLLSAFRAAKPEQCLRRAAELYRQIDSFDFSRAVLQQSASSVDVMAAAPCGWTDLGTPERVLECLSQGGIQRQLVPHAAGAPLDLATAARRMTAS